MAPGARRKPSGFDATDPSQYPGWGRYDAVLADAHARGLKVMFALAPPAPGWATRGTRRDREGVNRPSAREFGRFAEAAARHFPGVDVWTLWNEPNHPGHLYPQSVNGRPVAPHIYREMVRAGVRGLARGGAKRKPILFGELLPIGKSSTGPKRNLKPLRFLRSFFSRGKPLTGLDGFAYHPYTRPGRAVPDRALGGRRHDPLVRANRPGAGLRARARAHRRASASRSGTPSSASRRTRRTRSWRGDRAGCRTSGRSPSSGSPIRTGASRASPSTRWTTRPGDPSLWQSGLRFADGSPKTNIYNNFRLPILVRQLGPGAVEVRGDARPTGAGAMVQVQQRGRRGAFKNLGGPIQVRNKRGYFVARYMDLERRPANLPLHHRRTDQPRRQASEHLPLIALNPIVTLRRIMTRLIACLAAAAVLAGCGLAAAPEKSDAAVLVGIGDQDASMFTDPLFTQVGFKRARYFPSWNVALKPDRGRLARPVARAGAGHRHGAADLVLRRRLARRARAGPASCRRCGSTRGRSRRSASAGRR